MYAGNFSENFLHGKGKVMNMEKCYYYSSHTGLRKQGFSEQDNLNFFSKHINEVKGYVYIGDFVNGKHEGKGKLDQGNLIKYDGDWQSGMRHGYGIDELSNVDKFEGNFKNDKRNGQGKHVKGATIYEGEWLDDNYHAFGKLTCQNGSFYEGGWLNGKCDGYGEESDPNWLYKGEFKEGKFHGKGSQEILNKGQVLSCY